MVNFIKTQTSFAHGEVSPNFFANDDMHGLARMENMDVISGGGLTRRPGLKKIAKLSGPARLIPFSVSEVENYTLAIMNGIMRVFSGDTFIQDIVVPWSYSDTDLLQYAQRFGTIIFVHPNHKPKVLSCVNGVFQLSNFVFSSSDDHGTYYTPFMRFEDSENISISVVYSDGYIHFKTTVDFWTADNVGGYLSLLGKSWLVITYIGPRDIIATCNGSYTLPNDPVADWQEAAFSPRRGWPASITFHQNRLVFGGSKSWPGGVWMSHVGEHRNFDTGTGLDDEAIYFTLLSGKRQHICTLISSDNLQIFTSEGEWAVSNKPLTPESVDIKMHTSIGCVADRFLPPQIMEGTTVFISKNKQDIREMVLDDINQNYKANNLCALSEHLINNPTDIAYNKKTKKLSVVMSDGNMAVLNWNPALEIAAWGRYTTTGKFESVVTSGGETFVVTKRNSEYFLERFDTQVMIDANEYAYKVCARGLPLMSSGHNTTNTRIKKITVRVHNSKTLFINNYRADFPNEIYSDDNVGFSGDVSVNILGTIHEMVNPTWEISTTDALPLTVLSVTTYGRYQI
jgi:hypothetical protein